VLIAEIQQLEDSPWEGDEPAFSISEQCPYADKILVEFDGYVKSFSN